MACLDSKRLGNQTYLECLILIRGHWPHHPISKIWAAHKHALAKYALCGLDELEKRGRFYPHHRKTFEDYLNKFEDTGNPPIIGHEPFHLSHKSKLISKLPNHYRPIFGDNVPSNLPYVWKIE